MSAHELIELLMIKPHHKPHLLQFIRFAAVGLSGTAVQYSCLKLALVWQGESAAVLGSTVGYVLDSIVNYILNYFLTFGSTKSHTEVASKYFTVLGLGCCLNLGMMALMVDYWNWSVWGAQVISTGIGLCWNFAGSKLWAFKEA